MGLSGLSVWALPMVPVAVVHLFGFKRLAGVVSDLGSAIRDLPHGVSGEGVAGPSASEMVGDRYPAPARQE